MKARKEHGAVVDSKTAKSMIDALKNNPTFISGKDAERLEAWIHCRDLGAMVRYLREKKGISLRAFAGMVGVSPTYISFLERNTVKSPPTEKLIQKMAQVLEANVYEMLALAGRVSTEFTLPFIKHPQQFAALVNSTANLPVEEIEALTALAIRRQEEIMAKEDARDVREARRKNK